MTTPSGTGDSASNSSSSTRNSKSTSHSLPAQANVEHLKKQAKQLLQGFRAGDPAAKQSVANLHPKPASFSGLRDAQLVIARQYGCQDWELLLQAVEVQKLLAATRREQAEQLVHLACLRYGGDDRAWRYAHANALLANAPELVRENLYCALVAGNLAAVHGHLQNAPQLATQVGGPLNWPPLMYLTYSRIRSSRDDVLGIARLLLERGADPDSHVLFDGLYRFSALTGAMGEGERGPVDCPPHQFADALAALLLEAGSSPNEFQGLYNTMFTDSLDKWLVLLIRHGLNASHATDPKVPHSEKTLDFILSSAVGDGRIKRVWILLEAGANPNAVNRYNGRSAHMNALLAHQPDIAAALLQYGAKVEKPSLGDEFRIACWTGALQRAEELLEQKPALAKDPQVFSDIARSRNGLLQWLLERGFDINSQTPDGRTVLHRSAAGNELDEVKALVALGANPNLAERHYKATPLGFALHNRAWDVAHYLKQFSQDIFDVVRMGYLAGAAQLLARNPSLVHQRTPMGNTPLHVVSQALDQDVDAEATIAIVRLLLQHGADPRAQNNEGLTPPQFLRKLGNDEAADLVAAETAR
jgi:ankyrin repeat protein